MDENKSGLYIVAIVGILAAVALAVLVLGVSSRGTFVRGSGATADQTGRMYDVVETESDWTPDVEGGSDNTCECDYCFEGRVVETFRFAEGIGSCGWISMTDAYVGSSSQGSRDSIMGGDNTYTLCDWRNCVNGGISSTTRSWR